MDRRGDAMRGAHDREVDVAPFRDRLVGRIQKQLRTAAGSESPRGIAGSEVAELQERVLRLQSLGRRFGRVRLSSHVLGSVEDGVRARGGGVSVAMDR